MPSAELIEGLPLFSSNHTPSAEGAAASILSWLSGLQGSSIQQRASPKLVSVAAGVPVVPKKLVEQIQAGQYIDFCELPTATTQPRRRAYHSSMCRGFIWFP